MHEPDPQRGLGVEALTRHEVATRGAWADPREREGGDDSGDDPELHLREGEDGGRLGDRDVRRRDEPGSAAQCVALHPRHDRRGAAVDRLEHRPQRVRVGDVLLV